MLRDYRLNVKYLTLIVIIEAVISFFNTRHIAKFDMYEIDKVALTFFAKIGYNSYWYFFLMIIPTYILLVNYTLKNDISFIIRGKRIAHCKRNNFNSFLLATYFAISNALTTFFIVVVLYSVCYYTILLIAFVLLNSIIYCIVLCCFAQIYFILKNFLKHNILTTFTTVAISCSAYFLVFKSNSLPELHIFKSLYITRKYFSIQFNSDYVFYLGDYILDVLVGILVLSILAQLNKRTISNYEIT